MLARLAGVLACAVLASEAATAFGPRRARRRAVYAQALAHARAVGKPLLVLGDPDTGFVTRFFGRDYGCGDVCTDITGCPLCPNGIRGSAEAVLARLPSRSHVIAVEYTLEYVEDLPAAIRELERVAVPGGIHVARVEPGSLTSRFWFGGKWVLDSAPPGPWAYRRVR
jgi:hypothetical protein